jgi:hypothetical protein
MKICTESDYLQAHITIIPGRSRAMYPALQIALHRIVTRLKAQLFRNARQDVPHSIDLSHGTRWSAQAPMRK